MPMTKQEVFDTVAAHLLAQKERSAGDKTCMYRGPGGLQCAIGCLIPDEMYESRFEGLSVGRDYVPSESESEEQVAQKKKNLADLDSMVSQIFPDLFFLGELQDIHDQVAVCKWWDELRELATDHSLSTVVLDQFGDA